MAITIRNAILHVLYGAGKSPILSETELDIDSEVCEVFILKHVKKLLDNPAVRTATFKAESPVYKQLSNYLNKELSFTQTSHILAQKFDAIIRDSLNIMPCDLLFARIGHKTGEYMAILQLGYQEVYAHSVSDSDNQIKKYTALPFSSGKVEYAALIGLDGASMPVSLTEKPVIINGEAVLYFSELFLECDSSPSRKEQAVLLDETNEEFVTEYYKRDPGLIAKIKTAISQESKTEDGFVSVENIAEKVFDDIEIREKYINTLQEAGIADELPLGTKVVKQQFGIQKIKGENGIEIKFPPEFAENDLEIIQHDDGSVTVTIKRLRII